MMKIRIVKPKAQLVVKEEYHNRQMSYYHYGDTVEVDVEELAKHIWNDDRNGSNGIKLAIKEYLQIKFGV